ncbi:MAG: SdpI family protein [Bacteroidota bacterium]|nr:SdpI family protein [Bacteroidota bacterium]
MNRVFKIIAWLLIAAPAVYLAIAWGGLPGKIAVHFNLRGEADRYSSKNELIIGIGIMVLVAALIYLLVPLTYRIDPKKTAAANKWRLQRMAFASVVFISIVACVLIHNAENGNIRFDKRFVFGSIGLMWCILGNYMYNIKPNYFAGYRTRWALNNEENWKKTHLLAGKLWFAGGLLLAITCLLSSGNGPIIVFISVSLTITIIPGIYSYILYKKQLIEKN